MFPQAGWTDDDNKVLKELWGNGRKLSKDARTPCVLVANKIDKAGLTLYRFIKKFFMHLISAR